MCTHDTNKNVLMSTITAERMCVCTYVRNIHILYCLGIANALDLTDRILPRLQMRPECVCLHDCLSMMCDTYSFFSITIFLCS